MLRSGRVGRSFKPRHPDNVKHSLETVSSNLCYCRSEVKTSMKYLSKNRSIIYRSRGNRVLHLGCIGFTDLETAERIILAKKTLHWSLSQIADVIGVDYSKEEIEEYKRLGIFDNIINGNVEKLDQLNLTGKFDVIVAGDIIEHISNPGLMLEGLKRFCNYNTQIVLTTPNAFGLANYIRYMLGRFKEGREHVMTFNIHNMENLLSRYNYTIEEANTCYQPGAERCGILFTIGKKFFETFPRLGGTLFIVAKSKDIKNNYDY